MKANLKPEIEHFKKFHLLDLMSARHLNYLRERSIVVSYAVNDILFGPPRSNSMGYYLLEGAVEIDVPGQGSQRVDAGTQNSYCSLEDKLSPEATVTALTSCKVLQLSRVLVEQYFSWSTTGEYRVVDISTIKQSVDKVQREWMAPMLNSPLAKNLSEKDAKSFFSHFEDIRVREDDIIIHKGQILSHFYIVKSGTAQVVKADDSVEKVEVGYYFGDESLVPNCGSSIQVEMLSQGSIAKINKQYFKKYIADSLLQHVNPSQLSYLKSESYMILDVRFPSEYKVSPIENSINIPLQSLKKKLDKINPKQLIFISQESGPRGELASYILLMEGIRAYVLDDEISEYRELIG